MRQRRLTSLLFLLIFVICGGNSTTETIEPVEDATKVNTSTTNEATKQVEDNNQVDTKDNSDSSSPVDQVVTVENIKSIDYYGTSSHLEIVDESTLRLFYNDFGGVAVFLCSFDFNCEFQGSIQFITDLTLVETVDGERRGYFVEMNPNTMESGIFTAIFSDDGLSYSDKTPLGITAREDEVAWGVPDTVVMQNGLVRIYWVYTCLLYTSDAADEGLPTKA